MHMDYYIKLHYSPSFTAFTAVVALNECKKKKLLQNFTRIKIHRVCLILPTLIVNKPNYTHNVFPYDIT